MSAKERRSSSRINASKSSKSSSRQEGLELFMECEDEELTPAQLEAAQQAEQEYQDAIHKINTLKSSNASVKDIATNQSTAAVQPQIFNASSSSPNLIGAPRVAAVTSQAQQQSQQYIAIPNAVPVQALQSPPPGYKLLVDTRTGLIIGTMPPEGQAIITTPPQTPAPQNPVSLVPVKQTSKTSVPQIVNVTSVAPKTAPVPVSLSQAAVPHGRKSGAASIISKVNASTKPMLATSLLRVKRDEKPKTENAAISDVSPSSSKPAPQVQPVKKIITTYTPTIRPPNQYPSLNIKVVPQRQSSPGVFQQKRVDLDTTMKEILDQPMSKLVKWMFEHGLFHISQRCTIHRATQMQLILDTKNEKDRSGGYRWQCPVCDGVLPIQHRSFFDSLGYNFVFMLRLIYYWSCNEEILTVLRETQVDACFLRSVFALLRTICSNQIKSQIKLGGNDSKPVEFSIQLLKNSCSNAATVFIGCAYERGTGLIALRAFNSKLINKIENFLGDYIHTSSTLIVEKGLNLPATFINQHSYHIIPSSELDIQKCLILNAMAYVNERVAPMFGNTLMQMRIETVQTFLDELMWREKFGTNPYNTFNNILLHIKQHYGTGTANMKSGTSQPIQMPIVKVVTTSDSKDDNSSESSDTVSGNNIANQTPTRAFNANRKYTPMTNLTLMNPVKRQTSDETIQSQRNTVLLDNYYYAWKAGMDDLQGPVESNYKFKCHVCKKVLDNNIKIMRHLYAHIESSKQRNLDLSDLSQCKYCYREFETPFIMQCHVEDVHLKESNSLACRICEKAFQDKEKLIAHMYTTHTSAEMPYNCDVCKYRCSKYRTVIEHFEQAHNGSNHMQCHYCLRVFTIKCSPIQLIGMTSNFWNHIYKHQTKSLSRKCTACCLSFFSQPEMKNHRLNDHISFKDQPDVHTLEPPKSAESVYMLEPLRDHRGRIPRVKLLKACGSGTTTTQIRPMNQVQGQALVFESLLEVKIEGLEGMYCIECKSEMESAEHFKKYLGCSLCRFTTNCGKAYANHMISWHSQYPKKEVFGKEIHLPFRMYCLCGYSQIRGNLMAKHLVKCGKRSCYQDLEIGADSNNPYPSASFPPLVSLDEKSSDCNQPFSATVQDDSHTSTTLTEDKLQSDDQESNPSMLNILGLMRKPQKKTDVALPSGVRVQLSNEDSNLSNTSQSVDVSFEPGKESAEDSVDAELNRTKSPSEEHLDIECSNESDSNADSTSAVSVSSGRKRSREVDDPDEDSNSSAIKRMKGGYLIEKIKEEPFDESEIGDLETDMLYPKVQLEEIKVKEEPIDGDEESAVPDGADSINTNDKMEDDVDKNKQESSSKTLVKSNEDNVVSKDNSNAIADQVINVDCIKKETETESEVPEHCETSKDTSVTEKKANAIDSAPVLANNNSSSSNNNNNNSNNNNNNDSSNNNNTTTTTTSNSSPNRNTVSVITVQQETSRDTEEDSAPPILDCYAPESDS